MPGSHFNQNLLFTGHCQVAADPIRWRSKRRHCRAPQRRSSGPSLLPTPTQPRALRSVYVTLCASKAAKPGDTVYLFILTSSRPHYEPVLYRYTPPRALTSLSFRPSELARIVSTKTRLSSSTNGVNSTVVLRQIGLPWTGNLCPSPGSAACFLSFTRSPALRAEHEVYAHCALLGTPLRAECFSSIILSPLNSNVKMSPHETGDHHVESAGIATSGCYFTMCARELTCARAAAGLTRAACRNACAPASCSWRALAMSASTIIICTRN